METRDAEQRPFGVAGRSAARASVLVLAFAAGCGGTAAIERADPADGELAARWEAARLRLLDDYETWIGPVAVDARAVRVPTEVGWCYAWFAVGGEGVRDVDLRAVRDDGVSAGEDGMLDATPFVQYCADDSHDVVVSVIRARGRGAVAFGVVRKPD
ncbi:MAG: hypothetical protein H6698_08970 [Myxococcales bacterium]|nr:hypothetical protein [Myxococcales bacterium]MCB9531696.1 hypothetical protein [Myxococcales bacterium]MCB9534417.1 hypothetical protein [Myxococcales bacterium]